MNFYLTLYKKDIILPEPILLSGGKVAEKSTNYFLVIEKDNIKAFGEASPMLHGLVYKIGYGNPSDVVEKDLLFLCENLNINSIDMSLIKHLHEDFSHLTNESLACFDMAIHDFISKQKNIPIYKIYTDSEPIGKTLMIRTFSPQNNERIENELDAIKIKITEKNETGLSLDFLTNKYKYVVCDFNRMYKDVSLFKNSYRDIAQKKNNIFFEEPSSLGRINKKVIDLEIAKKIIVDDSFCDKEQLDNPDFFNNSYGINFKIQKIGGIFPCVEIAKKITKRQMIIGCNLETSLGISAGIHLGEILQRLTPGLIFTDLDSDILLGLENSSPTVSRQGRIPQSPIGLGFTPKIEDYDLFKVFTPREMSKTTSIKINNQNKDEYIYDRVADQYCDLLGSPNCHGNIIPNALRIFNEYSIFSGSVLDVGCGPGNLKDVLTGDFSFTGIDNSKKMLSLAKSRDYETIYGDILEELQKIPDKSFDHVVALSSLYFTKNIDLVMKEINRIAKKTWLVSLDQPTPKLINYYKENEGINLYSNFNTNIKDASENIYFSGWKSPTTNEIIKCRLVFKDLSL
jgi:ubiquinone/menaquinone biosynthesis C-methylase UbiE/L-alanine-DL-glutamate epimerase-like enolase superfamily enzyme